MDEVTRILANEAKREYMRKWRESHREEVNAYQRAWHKRNPEKNREYLDRYWTKKAAEKMDIQF